MSRAGRIWGFLFSVLLLPGLFAVSANAQRTKPADPEQQFERLVKNSKYQKYKHGGASFQQEGGDVIDYEGALGYLTATAHIAAKGEFNLTPELARVLLKTNYDIDFIKVGIDEDGNLVIRADMKMKDLDQELFDQVLGEMFRADVIVGQAVIPYLKKP